MAKRERWSAVKAAARPLADTQLLVLAAQYNPATAAVAPGIQEKVAATIITNQTYRILNALYPASIDLKNDIAAPALPLRDEFIKGIDTPFKIVFTADQGPQPRLACP